jgi:Methyltransferase domain
METPNIESLRAFNPQSMSFLEKGTLPTLAHVGSQLCTANQFREPQYEKWCRALKETPNFNRKQWEFVFICEVLAHYNLLRSDTVGLGFGVGKEPLPALFASKGCRVLATDLDPNDAASADWTQTNQHSSQLSDLNERGICDPADFSRLVRFRAEDMNSISPDLQDFDFTWSSCAFEHLGSIKHGLDFFVNSLNCLKPGGVAVHTTEFNLSSNFSTLEAHNLVLFRRFDIEALASMVRSAGATLLPVNFNPGTEAIDRHYDVPPYANTHLRIQLDRYVFTSIGLIAIKNIEDR